MRLFKVAVVQCLFILLLGFQQLNVVHAQYLGAAMTSFVLGSCGFWITGTVAEAKRDGMFSPVWWAYVLAGPIGICTAILIHPYVSQLFA